MPDQTHEKPQTHEERITYLEEQIEIICDIKLHNSIVDLNQIYCDDNLATNQSLDHLRQEVEQCEQSIKNILKVLELIRKRLL